MFRESRTRLSVCSPVQKKERRAFMRAKSLMCVLTMVLSAALVMTSPVFAHDPYYGSGHVDHDYSYSGHVDHDYRNGGHVDLDYSYGGHVDHEYMRPPSYGYDSYEGV
jgi:hypothetical protein